MSLKSDYARLKTLLAQGSELFLLRLRLLRLDMTEQLADVLKILALLLMAMVLLLVALMALLFALNALLPDALKMAVFGGITALALLLAVVLLWQIPRLWQRGGQRVGNTLHAMQNDLRLLQGNAEEKP